MARNKVYSLKEHMEVAMAYIICGTAKGTAQLTGVPRSTIRGWQIKDWWSDAITEAKKRKNDELDATLTGIIHNALSGVSERLKNGDAIKMRVKGQEELCYKPVGGKDQALIAAILIDKRAALRGDPTRITKVTNQTEDLANFRKALEEVGKQTENQVLAGATKLMEASVTKH